ncbi:conserved hypothetical protein [Nitrosopumilaceae archaeon]|nr:conserved hypothetical protein [Nitrosopumilaceae archaeon]
MITSGPGELSLSVKEADIGILYIIQHELLGDESVDFAGVIIKHPLTNECWMRVSSGSKPADALKKSTESAIRMADEFRSLFGEKMKG